MRVRNFWSRFSRGTRALIDPKSNEADAFSVLSHLSRYLMPHYQLPSYAVDWLHDSDFLEYQQKYSVSPATAHRHLALSNLIQIVYDTDGNTAECGAYRGASSSLILSANERDNPQRTHHIFDSFQGLSVPGREDNSYWSQGDLSASSEEIRQNLGDRRYSLHRGWIPERFDDVADEEFCFVHIDVDLYQPTIDALRFFYPRLSIGGIIVCDDYGSSRCPGATRACDEFTEGHGLPAFVGLPAGGGFMIGRQ